MFEKLKQKLQDLQKSQASNVDTQRFNDEIANRTEWFPLKSGGANFKTNILVKVSSSIYRYQLSLGGKIFIGIFAVVGLATGVGGLLALIGGTMIGLFFLLFGTVFSGAAYLMYRTMGAHIIFDATLGFLRRGKELPKLSGDIQKKNDLIYFNDIHAIQIISERVRSKNGSYLSYELNLILKDASRFNVVDHGNYAQINEDAQTLSSFLGKPIWDVC